MLSIAVLAGLARRTEIAQILEYTTLAYDNRARRLYRTQRRHAVDTDIAREYYESHVAHSHSLFILSGDRNCKLPLITRFVVL